MDNAKITVQMQLTTEEQRELISLLETTMSGLDEIYLSGSPFDLEIKDRYRIQNNIMNKIKNAQRHNET